MVVFKPTSVVAAAVAAVATYFAAATFPCPPLPTSKRIQRLAIGANASDAQAVVLAQGWSWRRSLAIELGVGQAYNSDGRLLNCAADVAEDDLVYHGPESMPTPQWHWPSEEPGHERVVSLRGPDNVTLLTLSSAPPLFLVRGLLTAAEADVLVAIAEPALREARIRMAPGGSLQSDERRTGETAWLHGAGNDPRREVAEATRLQQRVLRLLRMQSVGGGGGSGSEAGHSSGSGGAAPAVEAAAAAAGRVEPVHIEAFSVGHSYEPHVDYQGQPTAAVGARAHDATRQPPLGSNRLATVRAWLSDAADGDGGHEVFPFARAGEGAGGGGGDGGRECALVGCVEEAGAPGAPPCDFPAGEGFSQRRGLMARPKKGDALVWYSQTADGLLDGRTRHGTCPVLAGGRQLAATVWVWNRRVLYG